VAAAIVKERSAMRCSVKLKLGLTFGTVIVLAAISAWLGMATYRALAALYAAASSSDVMLAVVPAGLMNLLPP